MVIRLEICCEKTNVRIRELVLQLLQFSETPWCWKLVPLEFFYVPGDYLVCQKEVRTECNDSGIFNNIPKGGKNEIKKKKKSKKIQTNLGDILNHGVCNNTVQFDCGDVASNVDGDRKMKTFPVQEQEECLQESRLGRKRKKSPKQSKENESTAPDFEKKDANGVGFKEEADSSNEKDCDERPKKKQKQSSREEEHAPVPSCSSAQLIMEQYRRKLKKSDEAVLPHTDEEGNVTAQAQEEVGNLSEGVLPTEECSVSEHTVLKSRRKRMRRRKKKSHHLTRQPNLPWNLRRNVPLTRKDPNSSVNHIRFCSDDETQKDTAEDVHQTSTSVQNEQQQLGNVKPKPASVSKWDEKAPNRKYRSPQENNSGLTLDEVWDKTLPILRYQSSTIIFDCPKTELPTNCKSEKVDSEVPREGDSEIKDEIVVEDGSVKSMDIDSKMTSSPLEGLPRKNDLIAFKMFRLSQDYTPVLSNHITARVLEYDPGTFTVKLQILKGHEELAQPKGRFSLDDQPEERKSDIMELNWNEMLDPLLIFP
ncbi:coilin isoform X2 [Anabrus simplex]|uniref:coilin isoform X2 n=1 Tax=Anabrus simplex TaxID=316456 RepID=UPI0035A2E56B